MLPAFFSIGIRFSIAKLYDEPYSYGTASWLIFLESVPLTKIAGAQLFHGDTNDMLTFIIAVQSMNESTIREIETLVSHHARFRQFCADPPFVSGTLLVREPLIQAGRVTSKGELDAGNNCLQEAWRIFSRQYRTL